jgi:hypothetical protein
VIELLRAGVYKVDPVSAEIVGPKGRPILPYDIKDDGLAWVRVYGLGGCRTMPRSRLVWLSVVLESLPGNQWEIHHWDEDRRNDSFDNLYCLHRIDHRKLHRSSGSEEVPF